MPDQASIWPAIGDDILIMGPSGDVKREVIDYIPEPGRFHHYDEKLNDYFSVGVFTEHEEKVVMYDVRWDDSLQDWTQVGLTLDYEED